MAGFAYGLNDGGAIPDDGDTPDASASSGGNDDLVSLALATVDSALQYGRQKYGIGDGSQQTAGAMPAIPGTPSDSGIPRPQPMPGPLPPTSNPFGKRQQFAQAGYQNGRMPAIPGSQSNSGVPPQQPAPGPLPPTSNPFGKRQQFGDNEGAIPDDQEEAA